MSTIAALALVLWTVTLAACAALGIHGDADMRLHLAGAEAGATDGGAE